MAPPRLVFVVVSVLTLTFILTFVSLLQAHPRQYAAAESNSSPERTNFRSLFSFRTPSALFPSSAIISLTDDNSTFFLARPADFGPSLPADGLSGQLWVGSGFGDDSLGRGLAADTEGELGCSDVPGWRDGRKHHQGDGQFEPSERTSTARHSISDLESSSSQTSDLESQQHHESEGKTPSSDYDGTDDYLHHPLPTSHFIKSARERSAELQRHSGQKVSQHADIQSLQESAEISGKLVMLSRGGCGFLEKVKWVQRRGGTGLIVGDNTRGGALVTMYAKGDTSNVTIPALFTSRTTAHLLSSLIPPELPDIDDILSENLGANALIGHTSSGTIAADDQPTFTPVAFATRPTPTLPGKGPRHRPKQPPVSHVQQKQDSTGWLRYLFGGEKGKQADTLEDSATADSRRPPSSGRLTWVNEQWTESTIESSNDRRKFIHKDYKESIPQQSDLGRIDVHAAPGDGFEIGVHDWRDPDLVGTRAARASLSSIPATSAKVPTATALDNSADRFGVIKTLSGGSITPGSGEYQKSAVATETLDETSDGDYSNINKEGSQRQGWLGLLFWRGQAKEPTVSLEEISTSHQFRRGLPVNPNANAAEKVTDHQGLWVTLTPTTMSTSPFFDTLLVLVVSPLITLTVVYSLLLIRSRIRRRRWRAPKPRSQTASSIGAAVKKSLDKATANASIKHKEIAVKPSAKNRQYHGKQVECVVCLEEYVDGQSKVMKLPCGHEFHAECITPWLTTRRRTCPICKGDVVRSMAKPTNTGDQSVASPGFPNAESGDDIQAQAAETSNDSPTAAIPIPRDLNDLEQGDDMAATLVNDPPEASSSRRGWRGLASFSLSAFSGEAAWRQARADRDR
ncbi:MAG: hypothetical protein Q9170_003483 [Blastenia crenularia]